MSGKTSESHPGGIYIEHTVYTHYLTISMGNSVRLGPEEPIPRQTGNLWLGRQTNGSGQPGQPVAASVRIRREGWGQGARVILQPKCLSGAATRVWVPKGLLLKKLLRGGSWCLGGGGEPQLRALEGREAEENTELGLRLPSTWGTV